MAVHSHLGHVHSWRIWSKILPTDRHSEPGIHQYRTSAAPQFANIPPCHCSHRRHRIFRRQRKASPASIFTRHIHDRHSLLRCAGRLPIQRSRIRRYTHWQRMHSGILPTHVAVACANNITCDRKCFSRLGS